ncbi:hypothetical protein CCR75_002770 [Bremia lactucae]|uniref:DNA polymerase eta n=1 Tax=Bremia lactucae TaxID=4779 RepID=A0A976IIW3_BRELC|nr:hypothetical protein CCR75_002770 [Bremia lactucae]
MNFADNIGSKARVIVHLDLDCFYAQVEQRRLNIADGQPVAVQQWGYLLAVNYEARKFGVARGDLVDGAKKKCPKIHLVFNNCVKRKPHVDTLGENRNPGQTFDRTYQKAILRRYRVASREIFTILGSMLSLIEKASIDEAFMDVTEMAHKRLEQNVVFSSDFCQDPTNNDTKVFGIDLAGKNSLAFPLTDNERLLCVGAVIAREVRDAIYQKLGYTCSTGIANNKLLAKLASPLNKPNGQVLVAPRFVSELMKSLPMRKIRGLGGKLGKQLEGIYVSLCPGEVDVVSHRRISADETAKKLTANAFLQRCGLTELTKHVGKKLATHVHRICQGDDGDEPVQEKKVYVKTLGCVKQFDQRSGSALTRVEQLQYWVHLLCEEIIIRCEDERIENKRFPSQLTIQFLCAKLGEKPRVLKLGIAQDTNVEDLYKSAMNVTRFHLDSLFPLAAISMNAKTFHELESVDVVTISNFFSQKEEVGASVNLAAQLIEKDAKQDAPKRNSNEISLQKRSRQKISEFFLASSSRCGHIKNRSTKADIDTDSENSAISLVNNVNTKNVDAISTQAKVALTSTHYCEECRQDILEPRFEHEDFHFALKLSQTQHTDVMANAVATDKKKKKGPLDSFVISQK